MATSIFLHVGKNLDSCWNNGIHRRIYDPSGGISRDCKVENRSGFTVVLAFDPVGIGRHSDMEPTAIAGNSVKDQSWALFWTSKHPFIMDTVFGAGMVCGWNRKHPVSGADTFRHRPSYRVYPFLEICGILYSGFFRRISPNPSNRGGSRLRHRRSRASSGTDRIWISGYLLVHILDHYHRRLFLGRNTYDGAPGMAAGS